MSRHLKVAAAQLGPIQKAEGRQSAVGRMVELLKQADADDVKLVVFPELALTTFFPRYLIEDPDEVDNWFERDMPNNVIQPLFDEARQRGIAFCLGYAELANEDGKNKHYNTSIIVGPDGTTVGK